MRHRGAKYWLWINRRLPLHTHEEVLGDGVQIEVQARVSLEGITQLFIGVYDTDGWLMREEFHDRQGAEPGCLALKWGVQRAREIVIDSRQFVAPHKPQLTLSTVITDESVRALRQMEMNEREILKLKSSDAWVEYMAAKAAMLELMRSSKVDAKVWAEHKERLRQAIDRRVSVQRAYLR
ncbi:hypothetical protein [Pseudomonas sp. Y24-6]|jgi:hypothetical protein|uniref:hypothetical protein n=1 Tax=Pseudomonas sp. Y24-6 TaxID=2750013 RepID=UPI000F0900AB|nr:hypothetical protein [Pseudomonas sp. Y24-6]MCA4965373.1 hypothetical protein [Pseudomonas sp. Y24-6]